MMKMRHVRAESVADGRARARLEGGTAQDIESKSIVDPVLGPNAENPASARRHVGGHLVRGKEACNDGKSKRRHWQK
jgi:hypothetical protein